MGGNRLQGYSSETNISAKIKDKDKQINNIEDFLISWSC